MYDIYYMVHTKDGDFMRVEILIKEIRESKNITLDELAKKSGVSKSHLNYIERNEKEPSISVLCRVAIALKVDIKELYRVMV